MTSLTMLGTGNFLVPRDRYWNSLLVEDEGLRVLFEPSPAVLPALRKLGTPLPELDAIVVSHFHPDHTFGWPFLLLELFSVQSRRRLSVVGPPGVEDYFTEMMRLGSVLDIKRDAEAALDIRWVETQGSDFHQLDLPFSLGAVEVEHVPELDCFAYVLELDSCRLGYSGDTRPCRGLDTLCGRCDTLVIECNGLHPAKSHMDTASVLEITRRFPALRLIATHLGDGVSADLLPGVELPDDLDRIEL